MGGGQWDDAGVLVRWRGGELVVVVSGFADGDDRVDT